MFFSFSSFLLLVDLLHLGGFGLVSALQDWVGDKWVDMIWGMAWHGMALARSPVGFIGSARSCDIGFGLARLLPWIELSIWRGSG
ncbi:hypothetical protein BGZ57DRAFT_27884 [Hyaloscypha finlandica]|nr:hypothetical protein BGZ57DRAFT_27884 [Hyaloscypha finlandica]